jgi:hypothetical protein
MKKKKIDTLSSLMGGNVNAKTGTSKDKPTIDKIKRPRQKMNQRDWQREK